MSDLRVKLILDLVNRLTQPARRARDDIKGVGQAADALKRKGGADKLRRDMMFLASDSRRAGAGVKQVGDAADRLGRLSGAQRLQKDLRGVQWQADRAAAAIRAMNVAAPAGTGAGMGGSAALAAAGRGALLPLGGALGVYGAARGTVGQSISFEKAMADVKKKVDLPEGETFVELERQIVRMAIGLGQSREAVAGIVAEAGAAGVAFKDLTAFTRLAAKASVAWDMSTSEASQKLFELRASEGWNIAQLEDFADKVNALGDTSAAKERDILEMANRALAAAKAGGVAGDTSLAFLTAMRSVGIQPEVGARGFNAMVSKMATAGDSKNVAEGLKELGLNAKTMARTMRTDATTALLDLFRALDRSKDPVSAAVKIFGQDWFDEILRVKGSIPEVIKNLEMLRDPTKWRGSTEKNLNIELATTENHLKRLNALASEVGDRLGRWALPGINEAIERIIKGLDLLDSRNAAAKAEKEVVANAAQAVADNTALPADVRRRMIEDQAFRGRVQGAAGDIRTDRSNRSVTDTSRLAEMAAEAEKLQASIGVRKQAGATEQQLAFSVRRLAELTAAMRTIDPKAGSDTAAADADRLESNLAKRRRIDELRARVNAADQLGAKAGNRQDQVGFRQDAAGSMRELAFTVAPNVAGGGFGLGGPQAQGPARGPGPGLSSFGLQGGKAIKDAFTIDLGEAGMTIMERFAAGIRTGEGQATAAAADVAGATRSALGAVDASAAGQAVAASFAAGIRAGQPAVVAAAQELAAAAKAGAGGGAPVAGRSGMPVVRPLKGALHDGVPP